MLHNFFIRRLQYNKQARRFFITIVALGFTIDGVYAVLLNLYLLRLGYDTLFIGQVNSFGLLAFALMSFPAGILGTRWKSNIMLRVGLGAVLLGTILLPLAEFSPTGWQETWFMVTYALILSGFSLYFVNSAPFLMSVVERERQSSAFAIQTALLSLAAFIGSIFGGTLPSIIASIYNLPLNDPQPYRYTFMLVGFVMLAAFLVTFTIVGQSEEVEEEPSTSSPKSQATNIWSGFTSSIIILIAVMSLVRLLQVAGLGTASVYFNVYMDTVFELPTSTIGVVTSVARLIAVPIVLLAPRLIRRTSTSGVAIWASLVTALFLLPIAFAPGWGIAALGYIGALAMANLRFAAFIVYIMVLVPKRQQPVMAGCGEMAAGFSFALMAWGGGYIATAFSFRELFFVGSVLTGLGTLLLWLHLRSLSLRKSQLEAPVR